MLHILKIISSIILSVCCLSLAIDGHPQVGPQALYNLKRGNQFQDTHAKTVATATCGYSSCPRFDSSKLNVHVIAHTHDDVGWLKTVDQYYYGTKKRYSAAGVQYILDSVVPQLVMDPEKRFIYVEMSFFSKWWQEQDESTRSIVRRLVDEGRLEFINGGWCMNDEATVNYHSTIEQMTLGLRFLNETFGPCGRPKVGWQIDPFGHTNEQASLFAQFGFDGMFFTRISYLDKLQREFNKSLDIVWHGDRALPGQAGSIFTNIFRDGYDAPNGYCFDQLCLDDVLVDNKNSYEYNMDQKGNEMINFIRHYAKIKLTNHLLIPFGGDFQYSAAGQNFKSLDKLIKYIRANAPDIHIFYSTPSCYQYAVHQVVGEKKIKLPEKYDDFMPYDSSATVWWSGYFSSRPSVKLVEREVADLLQVTRIISLASLLRQQTGLENRRDWASEVRQHESQCLMPLWEILGDLQHHDAVTGTEKQHVADDYVRRASDAIRLCARFIGDIRRQRFNELMQRSPKYEQSRAASKQFKLDPVYLEETMFCPLLNISQCDALEAEVDTQKYKQLLVNVSTPRPSVKLAELLETKGVLVTVYNPLGKPVQQLDVRLPCNGRCDLDRVQVIHVATNESLKLTRLPVSAGVISLPFRKAQTAHEILFYANVPPLGSSSFVVSDENPDELIDEEQNPSDSILITDETSTTRKVVVKNRRVRGLPDEQAAAAAAAGSGGARYEYFTIGDMGLRTKRDLSQQGAADRVIVKFDMTAGVIVGLKRAIDGTFLNITQKFGFYYPSRSGIEPPGAYIFRSNSSAPQLLEKPVSFKMLKRQNGALIEIHQKWADWIWQTVRVDAKKNYIEFDYLVGPVPIVDQVGREVVTRYITSLTNEGVFFTDSNGRQMLPRHRHENYLPENLGGSFYPVVSTMMIKNQRMHKSNKSVEAVAILVDRSQAATSLNEGNLEFLIHRRHTLDDHFGVGEPLNEPGEDGRGLVTRGRHRLFLKFQDLKEGQEQQLRGQQSNTTTTTAGKIRPRLVKLPRTPRANLTFEESATRLRGGADGHESPDKSQPAPSSDTYIVHDQLLNDLKIESVKYALRPILTFDRLRVTAGEFSELLASDPAQSGSIAKTDLSLLNVSLPNNVHLVTLQPWSHGPMQLLVRLENLDNPLTLHPNPRRRVYSSILNLYKGLGRQQSGGDDTNNGDGYESENQQEDPCFERRSPRVEVDIEYLIKRIRITGFEELNLGANARLGEISRLDWTNEGHDPRSCDSSDRPTVVKLGPRQIRTLLASFQYL